MTRAKARCLQGGVSNLVQRLLHEESSKPGVELAAKTTLSTAQRGAVGSPDRANWSSARPGAGAHTTCFHPVGQNKAIKRLIGRLGVCLADSREFARGGKFHVVRTRNRSFYPFLNFIGFLGHFLLGMKPYYKYSFASFW